MDYDNQEDFTLSIRLAPDGFSFSTHSMAVDNSFVYREAPFASAAADQAHSAAYLAALEEYVLQHEELLQPYRRVEIVVASTRFTFIPSELYGAESAPEWYRFTLQPAPEKILVDLLEHTGARCVYGIDEALYGFLCRTFPEARFRHHMSVLSEYFAIKSRQGNTDKMICQLSGGMIDILCYGKGRLRLANSYRFRYINDAAYYVLATWKSLAMSQQVDTLHLAGSRTQTAEMTRLLSKYIAKVSPVKFPAQMFNIGQESLNAPFDLIVLPLCE